MGKGIPGKANLDHSKILNIYSNALTNKIGKDHRGANSMLKKMTRLRRAAKQ
jgi:hypothetical protein